MNVTREITKVVIAFAIVLTAGCAELKPRPPSAVEVVYQVANAYDFAQTVNTARRPDCGYYERDPFTKTLVGEHPPQGQVEGVWAAQAVFHYAVSNWLANEVDATDSNWWRAALVTWQVLTIADSVHNVVHNQSIGLRPFGAGCKNGG